MMRSMASLRDDYLRGTLDERPVDPDPIRQFERWFEEAEKRVRASGECHGVGDSR